MNQTVDEQESYRMRREWAKYSIQSFRFRYPEFSPKLYEGPQGFYVQIDVEDARFSDLSVEFNDGIRPMTCPVYLVREVDASAILLDESQSFNSELWLNGNPLSAPELNALFALVEPDLPVGGIDFNHELDVWAFITHTELREDQKERVRHAMQKLGYPGEIDFQIVLSKPPVEVQSGKSDLKSPSFQLLRSSNSLNLQSQASKHLIEQDEDLWRNFLEDRACQVPMPREEKTSEFSCLFDMADRSDIRLSELLTIYDRVDIIPDRQDPNWLMKHDLSVEDLMELVNLGNCRIILPYGAEYCRPDVLDGLASIDAKPPVLSRELAAKTFLAGESKDPLLYGAFTAMQRSEILSVIQGRSKSDGLKAVLASYGQMLANQHHAFMLHGAMASLNFGIGAHLGEIIASLKGIDARIELSAAGAGVEWAMALGSSWVPRSFGEGYEETLNSHIVASFVSRTRMASVDPVTSRMHAITDGLLAVKGVPPLEVARNFDGASVSRFRNLARRLMHQAPSQEEMLEYVEQINRETRVFEKRAERITEWKLDALAAGVVAKPICDAIDGAVTGGYASILAAWLFDALKERLPSKIKKSGEDIRDAVLGLAIAPSMDAVVVSRARRQISK